MLGVRGSRYAQDGAGQERERAAPGHRLAKQGERMPVGLLREQ